MGPAEQPAEALIAFVARQLGVLYFDLHRTTPQRDQRRREHAVELQRYLGLRSFGLMDWRACLRVGADAAWTTDRGEPIVQALLAHLRISGVVLPPATVLERIGLAARARARKKTFEALAAELSDAERDTLARRLCCETVARSGGRVVTFKDKWRDLSAPWAPITSGMSVRKRIGQRTVRAVRGNVASTSAEPFHMSSTD